MATKKAATAISPKMLILVFGGLAAVAIAGGAGLSALTKSASAESDLPKDLTVDALRAKAKDGPQAVFGTMRETIRREDLTDEQRHKVFQNMHKVGREMMEQRVEAYYAAKTEEEKNAILDQQIDEFQRMRDEWEKRRAEREAERKKGEEGDEPPDRPMFTPPSQAERKARSESRSADSMARMMAYFSAVRSRAAARGIQMGGPGGRGPGGGRPGRRGP